MSPDGIVDDLNAEQRRAVEAVRGPVCILAGAGSGKTTTITRRIANQVATGAFPASAILAVTFTDKAAGEMRRRLGQLGVSGLAARTFHAAALAQLRYFAPDEPLQILASKVIPLRNIASSLPGAYRFRPAGDLATEIERAKSGRVTPQTYLASLGEHVPPIPPDLMQRVFSRYEAWKREAGRIDFEDLLELTIRLLDEDEHALTTVRERYRAFTVDEFQDVNRLQQELLDRWLGPSEELCAVGDDYQAIYGFTGASPRFLLALPARFPQATVVRLEENYRSTPEVLELANRLVPRLGGAEKTLRATRPGGPPARAAAVRVARGRGGRGRRPCARPGRRGRGARGDGRAPAHQRTLGRLRGGVPQGGAAVSGRIAARPRRRPPAAQAVARRARPLADTVERAAREQGLVDPVPEGLGERELTRQNDLGRLVRLAEELDDGERDVNAWIEELRARFGPEAGRGVHLLTLHRAKGLEWDAVFLPRIEEKELPSRLSRSDDEIAEERRLLYVGLTRARTHILVSWAGRPSRFLRELGVTAGAGAGVGVARPRGEKIRDEDLPPAYRALKEWRRERSQEDGVPAYVVFHDATLAEIVRAAPRSEAELAGIAGVGPTKLERYGADVLAVLSRAPAPVAG